MTGRPDAHLPPLPCTHSMRVKSGALQSSAESGLTAVEKAALIAGVISRTKSAMCFVDADQGFELLPQTLPSEAKALTAETTLP